MSFFLWTVLNPMLSPVYEDLRTHRHTKHATYSIKITANRQNHTHFGL